MNIYVYCLYFESSKSIGSFDPNALSLIPILLLGLDILNSSVSLSSINDSFYVVFEPTVGKNAVGASIALDTRFVDVFDIVEARKLTSCDEIIVSLIRICWRYWSDVIVF